MAWKLIGDGMTYLNLDNVVTLEIEVISGGRFAVWAYCLEHSPKLFGKFETIEQAKDYLLNG